MALVTTGTSANAYIDLSFADSYWSDRSNSTWSAASNADKEAAVLEATQYIDSNFRDRFPGSIQTTAQRLEWPRIGAVDRSGRTLTGVPDAIEEACAELALAALSERLMPVHDRGDRVKSTKRKVGPITTETEYMDNAPSGRSYAFAEMLLSAVLATGKHRLKRA